MELHLIQAAVLRKLSFEATVKFKDLRVFDSESNRLSYHLQQLYKKGYIEKLGERYALTALGEKFIANQDGARLYSQGQPKVGVLVCVKNSAGDLLVCQRKKTPHKGVWGFPAGKVMVNESIKKSTERCLQKECGIEIRNVDVAGVVRIREDGFDRVMLYVRADARFNSVLQETTFASSQWLKVENINKLVPIFSDFHEDLNLFFTKNQFVKERII